MLRLATLAFLLLLGTALGSGAAGRLLPARSVSLRQLPTAAPVTELLGRSWSTIKAMFR